MTQHPARCRPATFARVTGVLCALVLTAVTPAAAARDARPDSEVSARSTPRTDVGAGVPVPVSGTSVGLVVDEVHDQLFLTRPEGTRSLVVTDLEGHQTGTVPVAARGRGTLDADGSTLVTRAGETAIALVDTESLAVRVVDIPGTSCLSDPVVSEGLVWFAGESPARSECLGRHGGEIFALDPATEQVTSVGTHSGWYDVLASPFTPGLVAVQSDELQLFDVHGGPAPSITLRASRWTGEQGPMAFSADGARLHVLNTESGDYSTADLSDQPDYNSDRAESIAVRDDGMAVLAASEDLRVYRAGQRSAFRIFSLDYGRVVQDGALGFGEEQIYALSSRRGSGPYALHVLTPREGSHVSLRIKDFQVPYGRSVPLRLGLDSASPNRRVTIVATDAVSGRSRPVTTVSVPQGKQIDVRVRLARAATLAAVYDGDAAVDGDRMSPDVLVTVRARVDATMLRATGGAIATYRTGKAAVMKAKVAPGHAGDCVTFEVQYDLGSGYGRDQSTSCITLDKRSSARVKLRGNPTLVGVKIRMRAVWAGDRDNLASRSDWKQVRFRR